jgi:hypothetical protein
MQRRVAGEEVQGKVSTSPLKDVHKSVNNEGEHDEEDDTQQLRIEAVCHDVTI